MIFKDIHNKLDYTGVRELGQFSDLEIRLGKINDDILKKVSEILNNESIDNYDLVGNYLNINFTDDYLRSLFLGLDIETEKKDKSVIIHFFSPNPGQNIHLGVLRNILLGFFVSNLYKSQYNNIRTETMLCDSGKVFETLLSIYDGKEDLSLDKDFYDNPLLEYENKAKKIVHSKEFGTKKWSNIESRGKVTDFSLRFFENQLSKLGLSFDEVSLQSKFSYVNEKLLSVLEREFKIYRDGDGDGL